MCAVCAPVYPSSTQLHTIVQCGMAQRSHLSFRAAMTAENDCADEADAYNATEQKR